MPLLRLHLDVATDGSWKNRGQPWAVGKVLLRTAELENGLPKERSEGPRGSGVPVRRFPFYSAAALAGRCCPTCCRFLFPTFQHSPATLPPQCRASTIKSMHGDTALD